VTGRTDWTAVAVALAAGVVAAAYVGKLPPALPLMKAEFGLSLVAAGWVVSMFNVIAIAGALFFGLIADRVGAFRFCLVGLALLGAGGIAGAASHGGTLLLASRFVEGAGFIAVAVSAPSLIAAAAAPRDRRLALALWSIYMPFGIAVTVFASTPVTDAGGWRGLWIAIVAATAACLIAVAALRGIFARPPGGGRRLADLVAPLREPAPWAVATSMGLYTLQWMAVMTWLPTYLVQVRGASPLAAASLSAVFSVANMPGILLGAWLLQRNAPRGTLIVATFAVMALCNLAIFSAAAPDPLRYAAALGLSFFGGVIPAAVMSSSQRYAHTPSQVGGLQGLIVQLSNIGQFIGPLAVAAVVSATGRWESALGVVLAAAGIGLALGIAVGRFERRLPAPV
jgi:predicted MFS family arabinose efflux permease